VKRREGFERLEQEIVREKAAALGRTGERLEAALADVEALARALDAEPDPERRPALLQRYESARQRAMLARTMLLIQREAIGLRYHRDVDRQFPEPPRRS
jgi:2-polyprenyl-6-methoxyphenol hydroxylase-like FAD-dependent oxidoreductase